jgi:hypothetical protein
MNSQGDSQMFLIPQLHQPAQQVQQQAQEYQQQPQDINEMNQSPFLPTGQFYFF